MTSQEKLSKAICKRFDSRDDIIEEFNKLEQDKGVEDYIEKFEKLKYLMSTRNSSLPESYYVSIFISGLKEDIKPMLKILRPTSLMQSFK